MCSCRSIVLTLSLCACDLGSRSPDACYLSRHVALKVGARVETPALTVNRLCGSGFETVVQVSAGEQVQHYPFFVHAANAVV